MKQNCTEGINFSRNQQHNIGDRVSPLGGDTFKHRGGDRTSP